MTPRWLVCDEDEALLATEQKLARTPRTVALMTLGTAAQKYMMKLGEPAGNSAGHCDIIMMRTRWMSAILRAQKLAASQGEDAAARYLDMTRVFCNDAVGRIDARAKNTLAGCRGDELRTLLAALRRFTKLTPMNTIIARQPGHRGRADYCE